MAGRSSALSVCWFARVCHVDSFFTFTLHLIPLPLMYPTPAKLVDNEITVCTLSVNSTRKPAFCNPFNILTTNRFFHRLNIYSQPFGLIALLQTSSLYFRCSGNSPIQNHTRKSVLGILTWFREMVLAVLWLVLKHVTLNPDVILPGTGNHHWKCHWL